MDFHILGPLQVLDEGREVALTGSKQRALLALLLLHANEPLSSDRLIDEVWGEHPPATPEKALQVHISRLRKALAARPDNGAGGTVVTRDHGYELELDPERVDAHRFERLVTEGRRQLAAGRSRDALSALEEALSLWRGAPLADLAYEPFAQREIARLSDLRIDALELLIEAKLAQGDHAEVVGQLETLIGQHPYRERLRAQLMLALYRSDRQADALQAYQNARRQLVEELGIEPGAELRELHARILGQDPSLLLPAADARPATDDGAAAFATQAAAPSARARSWLNARRLVVSAAAVALVAIAVFAIARLTGPDHLPGIDEGAVGVIDPEAVAITSQHRTGSTPGAVAGGAGSTWVASPGEGTVSRIRHGADRLETIDVGPEPSGLAFGGGSLWVAGGDDGAVVQVDPRANRVVQRIRVGNGLRAVAVGHGAVWAATALDGEVVRIDLRSGRVTRRIAVGGQPVALATGAGAVWVAAEESGTVARIDPRSGEVTAAIAVGNGPSAVTVGLGAVWSANRQDGTVSRIDPATNRVTDTTRAGREPVALTIADGALWVADGGGAVLRLDPDGHAVAERLRTGSAPAGLATVDGSVWATAVAPPSAHRGGILRVGGLPRSLDPAVGGWDPDSARFVQLAYEGLLDYRREGGAGGARLIGGLATGVPKPADGGRRYVFHLRRGLRYSDGTPVRAGDFRASMERAWAVGDEPGMPFPDSIEGVPRCREAPRRCDLSRGIVADERARTVTLRLSRPDPELLPTLTFPLLSVVPADTPRRALTSHPPAGTGPYRVERALPGRRAVLARNPHFGPRGPDGRPVGYADRIEATGGSQRALMAALERGRLDLVDVFDPATPQPLAALRTRIGTRLRSASATFTEYAWLNVEAPPFDDQRVRRALNLAIDRARVVDLTGGPIAGAPTCQLLPPGLPGYRPICPFTAAPSPASAWTAPDQAEARRLVAASGARGTAVEVLTWTPWRGVGRHLVEVLRELGFRSRQRVFADLGALIDASLDPRRRPQIGLNGWLADNPEPADFLNALVSCHGFGFGPDTRIPNLSRFCDPGIDAAIERARAEGPDASAAWQRIERRIAERAPVVPLTTRRSVVATSPRAGNLQFHPSLGVMLDQVWVR
jgi:YVTN family beta-propeller protein